MRDELMWNHTSSMMCLTANINAAKGKKFEPKDFNPYSEHHKKLPTKKEAEMLYETFKSF